MARRTTRSLTCKITVELPDLGFTPRQLKALKETFKNLVVATLRPSGNVASVHPTSQIRPKHATPPGTRKPPKRTRQS
jgi:hypothetical protein